MQNNFRMRTPLTRTLAHPRPPARAWGCKSCTAATSNRARIAKGHTESVGRSVPRDEVSPLRLGTGCFFAADAGSGTAQARESTAKAGCQTRHSDHRPAYRYHRARRAQQVRTPFASLVSPLECLFRILSLYPPNPPVVPRCRESVLFGRFTTEIAAQLCRFVPKMLFCVSTSHWQW